MPIYNLGEKKPQLPSEGSYWVAPDAHVIGNVILGQDVGIWFGSVLRGDMNYIKIGRRTNIQDNCTVHVTTNVSPTIIGDEVTVGHNAVIHGCKIKNRCLIGINSTILDNSIIGEGSIIGAGAVIPPNTLIPERSLVLGIPGTIIRKTTEDEYKMIIDRSQHYIDYSKKYIKLLNE